MHAAVYYADGEVIVTGQPDTTALAADGWVAVEGSGHFVDASVGQTRTVGGGLAACTRWGPLS